MVIILLALFGIVLEIVDGESAAVLAAIALGSEEPIFDCISTKVDEIGVVEIWFVSAAVDAVCQVLLLSCLVVVDISFIGVEVADCSGVAFP